MGPDQAASVVTQVRADSAKSRGESWGEEEQRRYYDEIKGQYLTQTNALYATARLWDDGIILPTETRSVLSRALSLAPHSERERERAFGTFRM
jgi:3-methylcrotonyl-CoA carboxylase beta subunit